MVIMPKYRNVSDDQWKLWAEEVKKLTELMDNTSGTNYLINAKSFLEYQQQIPLQQYEAEYPEKTLYVELSEQSQQQADRRDQLIGALRQHSYDPTYTGDDIPVTVTIRTVNVPANYLSLPSRATSKVLNVTKEMDKLWEIAKNNTGTVENPLEEVNETLSKPPAKGLLTGGISGKTWMLIAAGAAVVLYLIMPKNKKS